MTKYTAEDFANAKFAEHQNPECVDARFAARMNADPTYPWLLDGVPGNTDEAMSRTGWVPVPTKPTITESELEEACGTRYESDDFFMGFIRGFEKAGGTVLEETTRERVARLVNEIISNHEPASIGEKVADRLISLGLVKDN